MALWGKKSTDKTEPPAAANNGAAAAPVQTQAVPSTGQPAPQSVADQQKRAEQSARMLMKFGEIVSVLMRSDPFKALPIATLEGLVIPPLNAGQAIVAEARSKSQGFVTPVAAVLWARVSPAVDAKLSQNLDKPIQLAAEDWTSGDIPWLIAAAGEQKLIGPMLKGLVKGNLGGKPIKSRTTGRDGKPSIVMFTADEASAA